MKKILGILVLSMILIYGCAEKVVVEQEPTLKVPAPGFEDIEEKIVVEEAPEEEEKKSGDGGSEEDKNE